MKQLFSKLFRPKCLRKDDKFMNVFAELNFPKYIIFSSNLLTPQLRKSSRQKKQNRKNRERSYLGFLPFSKALSYSSLLPLFLFVSLNLRPNVFLCAYFSFCIYKRLLSFVRLPVPIFSFSFFCYQCRIFPLSLCFGRPNFP